ncbi:hypothetical protein [Alteribacillus sp. YIM 98480]|uniref:hypothetical protein n=1 Tax=Alteribacillus sp. YIM 98480 TaxID=2606599 RepID=UPI00131BA35D|nr:hypothetical protein [Alteribacillus sp. YIM 98480]
MFNNNNNKNNSSLPPYTVADLLNGHNLDIIAAVLLVTGKLKVNTVEIYRGEPTVEVHLIGDYKNGTNDKATKMADFLKENGDMTVDDVMEAIKQRLSR